jgi:hypothetical protein
VARYGVMLGCDGAVDAAATDARRNELRGARVFVRIEPANEDDIDGPRRRFALSAGLAARLGIGDGALIELRGEGAVALRGWVRVAGGADDAVPVGPSALRLLAATPGDRIELRAVRPAPEV